MEGDPAPAAPQKSSDKPSDDTTPSSPTALRDDVAAAPAVDQPGSTTRTRAARKAASSPDKPESPRRPKRTASAVIADADDLRFEGLETRLDQCESELAQLKKSNQKRPSPADDTLKRLQNTVKDLSTAVKDLSARLDQTDKAQYAFDKRIDDADNQLNLTAKLAADTKAALDKRFADTSRRLDSLEQLVAAAGNAVNATNEELSQAQEDLRQLTADAIDDWNTFAAFRRDMERHAQEHGNQLDSTRSHHKTSDNSEQRQPPSRRRATRARDSYEEDDNDSRAIKRPRRGSTSTSTGRASPADVDPREPVVYEDGDAGEDDWITCRIGQPSCPDGTPALTWKDDKFNMRFVKSLCENLAHGNGGCPVPVKTFLPPNDNSAVWRYFQFSTRPNFERFMAFWRKRDEGYSSLRAIPVADTMTVASLADLMRKSQTERPYPSRNREGDHDRRDRRDRRRA